MGRVAKAESTMTLLAVLAVLVLLVWFYFKAGKQFDPAEWLSKLLHALAAALAKAWQNLTGSLPTATDLSSPYGSEWNPSGAGYSSGAQIQTGITSSQAAAMQSGLATPQGD